MRLSTYAGIALLAASGAAAAQQPLALPGRSQSSWQQSVDTAACYAYANQNTKVNMAREAQTPPRDAPREPRPLSPPRPLEPPLPPAASGALAASAASSAVAASGATGASAVTVAGASGAHAASAPQGASAALPASGIATASGASDAILSGDMKMPPLPPPEPPMVRYWRAYSDCMQNRGYFVR
ncbi:hypothetical protein QCE63_29720 [Caballeronia sp. LZ065]|uniref:hypothetical protein n=1 Tax=Caballeronia sp. LZ065 TaxID=3038571 RepID=UPI00285B9163|nr:hypothetical protein [Caballeronia sp. LZ065]MDR5783597.1 hypothetical protein [Caballeronia sp. LZ065]